MRHEALDYRRRTNEDGVHWAGYCVDSRHSYMPLMIRGANMPNKFCTGCACPCHLPENASPVGKFLHALEEIGFLDDRTGMVDGKVY